MKSNSSKEDLFRYLFDLDKINLLDIILENGTPYDTGVIWRISDDTGMVIDLQEQIVVKMVPGHEFGEPQLSLASEDEISDLFLKIVEYTNMILKSRPSIYYSLIIKPQFVH